MRCPLLVAVEDAVAVEVVVLVDVAGRDEVGDRYRDGTLIGASPAMQEERLERVEQLLMLRELRWHGDNRPHTARTVGISVRALQKKIAR